MKIAFYGAAMRQWGRINPRCLLEDYPSPAGSEIALMGVARGLAQRGHQVRVFLDCEPGTYEGVEYLRADLALPILTQNDHDAVISWQDSQLFMYPLKTRLRVLMSQGAHLQLGMATEQVDRYFAISRFSAKVLLDSDPAADPSKMWVTRNGVLLERFGWANTQRGWELADHPTLTHDHHHLVWASSPDRGLHHLVDIFQLVKAQVPNARLTVCYDFDRAFQSYHNTLPGSVFCRWLEKAAQLKEIEGVEVLQHITQPQLANLYMSAGILAYPCDPVRETETYCVTVNEAMAAGLPVFVSDADCLPENYDTAALVEKRPIDAEHWARDIIHLMQDEADYESVSKKSLALAAHTDYSDIAAEWETLFSNYLAGREAQIDFSLASRLGR